ncbi:condensation domain-containing protein [Kitasatospora paracochleata]|uniref:Condensation domain-containing protein n=1 Tax=Kitasatospora paracochleata TaxID=58354 RepID=A0ABT1J236_9ACTN|nr:condensation domain-containing protein [Kitasatospora paracochleata]MCP2310796.1 hypothetical protein [Kitasatospora paracochleata]
MLQVAIEDVRIDPGDVYEWNLVSPGMRSSPGGGPTRRIAGYNQAKHFTVAQHAQSVNDPISSYVAGTFELPGPVDLDALEAALLHLVRRHEVLRAVYRPLVGDLSCDVLEPDELALKRVEVGRLGTESEVRAHLHETFTRVDTLSWPLIVMGAVVRAESTTVFFSCDHLVTDGLSTPIAINDIATAYEAFRAGREPELPDTGSYLEFSREQRRRNRAMHADDERLDHWREFIDRSGSFFPRFPLELGVGSGGLHPPVNETEVLLTDRQVEELDAACRAAGGRLFMGLLAAVAVALRDEGGPEVYRGLMPINERGRGPYAEAMGWFINTMPIEFPVARGTGFAELLADVGRAYATVQAHVDVHFVKAWRLLAPVEYSTIRYWPYAVNFFSYLDFRRTPGAAHHEEWQPRMHVWVSRCNGILFWLYRNDSGLHVNSIYVDTPEARRTKAGLVGRLGRTMEDFLRSASV